MTNSTPIIRAIVTRSIEQLDQQIKANPNSVFETIDGFTTLHLCRRWAPGLKRLLETRARHLINERDPYGRDFLESMHLNPGGCMHPDFLSSDVLAIILELGFSFFPNNTFGILMRHLDRNTYRHFPVITWHMADRLRKLSEAVIELDILQEEEEHELVFEARTHVPDFSTAASWCSDIKSAGKPLDPSLLVPLDDSLIASFYHHPELKLRHFKIFFDHGFHHQSVRDIFGHPPIFSPRRRALEARMCPRTGIATLPIEEHLKWLIQYGFLT